VTQTSADDRDLQLASLVASIENDLGKLKERLNNRGSDTSGDVQDKNIGNGVESRLRKPPPGERLLKRQASTVKSNLDRVCREKQHLQAEVESLRRYLLKRRDSAMEIRKKPSHGSLKRAAAEVENHLEGIKTLQTLLAKSDEQLRQSNEIISRLEAVNDETEEKLRDAEVLQDDMRCAVQIANTFAMEEQERADKIMLQNQELLKTIEMLKSGRISAGGEDKDENSQEKPIAKGKSKFQLKGGKGFNRSLSEDDGLYADDESNFTTEGESDFFSSRHSSIASESDLVTSPTPYEDNVDSAHSNAPAECTTNKTDAETEGTSQHSSTADTSDLTDNETE